MSETSQQSTCLSCKDIAFRKAFDCYRTTLRGYALAPDWETKKALFPQNEIVMAEVQRARNAVTWATDPGCEVCNVSHFVLIFAENIDGIERESCDCDSYGR